MWGGHVLWYKLIVPVRLIGAQLIDHSLASFSQQVTHGLDLQLLLCHTCINHKSHTHWSHNKHPGWLKVSFCPDCDTQSDISMLWQRCAADVYLVLSLDSFEIVLMSPKKFWVLFPLMRLENILTLPKINEVVSHVEVLKCAVSPWALRICTANRQDRDTTQRES